MSMFNKIVEYASRQLEIPAEEITRDTTFESLVWHEHLHLRRIGRLYGRQTELTATVN